MSETHSKFNQTIYIEWRFRFIDSIPVRIRTNIDRLGNKLLMSNRKLLKHFPKQMLGLGNKNMR